MVSGQSVAPTHRHKKNATRGFEPAAGPNHTAAATKHAASAHLPQRLRRVLRRHHQPPLGVLGAPAGRRARRLALGQLRRVVDHSRQKVLPRRRHELDAAVDMCVCVRENMVVSGEGAIDLRGVETIRSAVPVPTSSSSAPQNRHSQLRVVVAVAARLFEVVHDKLLGHLHATCEGGGRWR